MALDAPTDGPLGDSALLIDDGEIARPEHERLPADRPGQAAGARAARPAVPPVLRGDLVPDGLRVPGPGQGHAGPQEAGRPAGANPALHRDPGPDLRRSQSPDRRASWTTTCSSTTTSQRDPANIFPDQTVFLDHLAEAGIARRPADAAGLARRAPAGIVRRRSIPSPTPRFAGSSTSASRTCASTRRRVRPLLDAEHDRWRGDPDAEPLDLLAELKAWFEPLMVFGEHHLLRDRGARSCST